MPAAGDFEGFFESNYQPVVRALALAFGDHAEIEDAAQEAFGRAYAKWSMVAKLDRPATWVYVVAARRLRRSGRRSALAAALAETRPSIAEEEVVVANRLEVERLLGELPPRQRATIVLRYLAGLTVEETAQALRCAPGTVKAATAAGLRHLRVAEERRDA